MKNNKDDKSNKKVSFLNFLASTCFYICAVLNVINDNNNMAVIYFTLGSTFLCLGGVYMKKIKK